MKVLILGASGMIGGGLFSYLNAQSDIEVYGTVRSVASINSLLFIGDKNKIYDNVDVLNLSYLSETIKNIQPDIVINGIGIVKQQIHLVDPVTLIKLNALFPHELHKICLNQKVRLLHISTDCVFNGTKGYYSDGDPADALDSYGKTKALGELNEGALTIRTSTIGHEIKTYHGLLEWFLSQEGVVNGYSRAIYSGVTTIELAKIIYKYILFNDKLVGLYNLSSDPINKFDLLNKINKVYRKNLTILREEDTVINRSLNAEKFRQITGYLPLPWDEMLWEMKSFYKR